MSTSTSQTSMVRDIPIVKIKTGGNPRKTFNDKTLSELAATIKEHGVIQPITVEPDGDQYILVAGERRLRASKLAGLRSIPAIVRGRSNHNGRERFILSIIENDQREDMNPVDRAEAYKQLMDEHGMTVSDISKKLGKTETVIYLALLFAKLDEPIKALWRKDGGWFKDARLAKALLAIEDSETRIELAKRMHERRISLKGCLNQCTHVMNEEGIKPRKAGRPSTKTPAVQVARELADVDADEVQAPPRWDMLRQMGTVPAWTLVVDAARETCEGCALRGMASPSTCGPCGAVQFVRLLMEKSA